jgi:hypothetical protein
MTRIQESFDQLFAASWRLLYVCRRLMWASPGPQVPVPVFDAHWKCCHLMDGASNSLHSFTSDGRPSQAIVDLNSLPECVNCVLEIGVHFLQFNGSRSFKFV